jgi:predicted RNA-binding protein with PIN domain
MERDDQRRGRHKSDMHIIIDGYNLIRQSDTLRRAEKISLEQGRKALLDAVSLYRREKGHSITVVFDGWENGSPVEERDYERGVFIIYSRLGEKADEVIKRIVQSKGEEIVVVTSDIGISQFAERRGSTAISSRAFEARLAASRERRPFPDVSVEVEDGRDAHRERKRGSSKRPSRKKKADLKRMKKL